MGVETRWISIVRFDDFRRDLDRSIDRLGREPMRQRRARDLDGILTKIELMMNNGVYGEGRKKLRSLQHAELPAVMKLLPM